MQWFTNIAGVLIILQGLYITSLALRHYYVRRNYYYFWKQYRKQQRWNQLYAGTD